MFLSGGPGSIAKGFWMEGIVANLTLKSVSPSLFNKSRRAGYDIPECVHTLNRFWTE
jgi:hypothetical protein